MRNPAAGRTTRRGQAPLPGRSTGRREGAATSWTLSARVRAADVRAAAERDALARGIRNRRIFLVLLGTILAVAAVNVLMGTVGLLRETRSRPLTVAERQAYVRQDIARRWHAWPAAVVFPEELEYIGLARTQQYARRVGIAPEVACGSGTDAPVAGVLAEAGCQTLLRATYVDQSATFAITVGVAVLRDEEARLQATAKLPVDDRVGVRPVAFPGTVTELFGAAQRQRNGWVGAGPYIVFSTAGYTDGRTREAVPPEEILHSELWPTAQSIAGRIARSLGEPPTVPRCTQGPVC
ncbi:hypothetical protein HNP84_003614 [Thermocatellispora tengchongensis]|uniref:Uncharacterized protein n=1 Tax=Thermocatellispora tengchongensis TaxID=1073253 RepID=A0A840P2I0_9ACTN|nr:hypothetical protein [Thermocatellispora tengchongensis]MBB5133888.1 hypothetical protein [Thermocatellispora tengchongensis]